MRDVPVKSTLLWLLAAGAALAALAQAPKAPADGEAFFEALDVTVVNVEVYVTDRHGRPVTGLTAADFELLEDGRRVPIAYFYAVEDGATPTPESDAANAPPPPPLPVAVPEEQRLYLVIYVDNLHLRPFGRNRALRELRRFLSDAVGPEDRVMVATFERALHVRQEFTSDRAAVRDALFEIETLSAFGAQADAERRRLVRQVEGSREVASAAPLVDLYAQSRFDEVGRSIDALRDLVASLAGLPGRKALVYVSDGLPMTAGADLFHLLDLRFRDRGRSDLRALRYGARDRFRELVETANAHRVTFYTLEAAGLRSHASLSAESRAGASGSQLEADVTRELNLREPLELLAADTGGLAATNTNNLAGALERLAADLGTYYSLGYSPAAPDEGRRHRLEVEVKRPGLSVRHRTSYRAKSVATRLEESVLAALRHGVGVNPLRARLEVAAHHQERDGLFLVPVTVAVPFTEVALVPWGETYRGRLAVTLAVIDAEGDTSTPQTADLPLAVPAAEVERARDEDVVYAVELLMRRGRHQVAVAIRDAFSGEVTILRREVVVGK